MGGNATASCSRDGPRLCSQSRSDVQAGIETQIGPQKPAGQQSVTRDRMHLERDQSPCRVGDPGQGWLESVVDAVPFIGDNDAKCTRSETVESTSRCTMSAQPSCSAFRGSPGIPVRHTRYRLAQALAALGRRDRLRRADLVRHPVVAGTRRTARDRPRVRRTDGRRPSHEPRRLARGTPWPSCRDLLLGGVVSNLQGPGGEHRGTRLCPWKWCRKSLSLSSVLPLGLLPYIKPAPVLPAA
jgi:hypothetical protein